jgi:hypothetical protein
MIRKNWANSLARILAPYLFYRGESLTEAPRHGDF